MGKSKKHRKKNLKEHERLKKQNARLKRQQRKLALKQEELFLELNKQKRKRVLTTVSLLVGGLFILALILGYAIGIWSIDSVVVGISSSIASIILVIRN